MYIGQVLHGFGGVWRLYILPKQISWYSLYK